ncbi:unnamed protein product [Spirodela intermedia]|uniref:RRM domain-containing protein n=1 Tax=Spirodela intermedia TaxID=51605 RepID=A0A7I8JAD2_SPIIN|nr:unnamed protein product [Spirodela intermedia]CAA6666735.1 unnamed protein product [Spirodela intermedia]
MTVIFFHDDFAGGFSPEEVLLPSSRQGAPPIPLPIPLTIQASSQVPLKIRQRRQVPPLPSDPTFLSCPKQGAENPGNTLYVTGLSTRVTERDLEIHFSKEGKVAKSFLVVEPRTRISRGFAFVTMDTFEDADRCVEYLNQSVLQGRYITVEKSRRKRPRTPTPGNYLGVKSTRETSRYYERNGYRGGDYGREDYGGSGYRRFPRRSYYRGGGGRGGDYSPPYGGGGKSRRERSRSLPYSPYGSPEGGGYGRHRNVYGR